METIASPSKECPSASDEPITLEDAIRHLLSIDDAASRRAWMARCLALTTADELFPRLKLVSEEQLGIDQHAALRIAEAMIVGADLIGRREHSGLGLIAKGDALGFLGRFDESVATLDEGAQLFLSLDDEVGWARTRIGWIWSYHRLGHGEATLSVVDRARDIFVRHNDQLRAATLDLNAGWVCYQLGRHVEALQRYDRALAIYEALGESAHLRAAWVKSNKANLLWQLGDFGGALRLLEEVRSVYLQRGTTVSVTKNEYHVAFILAAQGHYTRALRHYRTVSEAFERAGLPYEVATVLLGMIDCYLNLNRPNEAFECAEDAIVQFERLGIPTEAAKARFLSAIALARMGDIERALTLMDQAGQAFSDAGLVTQVALVTVQRATMHLGNEDWTNAREGAERASALFAEYGLVIRQAQADLVRARAALAMGDSATSSLLAENVLSLSDEWNALWLRHEAEHILGSVAELRNDFYTALASYERAIASIEQMQSTLAIELRTNFLEDKLRVFEDAIAVSLRLSQPMSAFAFLERAKSRALVDYLGSNLDIQIRTRDNASPELLETLTRLREEHNGLYGQLYGLGWAQRDGLQPARIDTETLRSAIYDREKQIARILERLALDRTEGIAMNPPGAREDDHVPRLTPGTLLLEYFFRETGGAVFVVSAEGLEAVPLAVSPRDIGRLLQQWQLNLATTARAIAAGAPLDALGRNARGILASLYRALLGPVAAQIAGCERLIIIPYGATHAVPFHALHDGQHYLLERHEVSVSPSSRLLRICEGRPRSAVASALIVAHTDGGRLPAVLDEARAVAALLPAESYTEERATRSAIAAAAPRHSVIHLAAHGEARLDNPAFAHLRLADGQLSMVDVFNLDLRGALVTLSACETGRSVVVGGDELVGLSRGFLFAGASTLVQSLWRVEDGSTADLMGCFYRGLRAGQTKGAALRTAQRELLAAKGAHPYHWAPFQLIGDHGSLTGPCVEMIG